MQLYMRRYGSQVVAAGADSAIVGWPLPNECTLNYLKGEVHCVIGSAVAANNAMVYGCQGWILKSHSTADYAAMDTLWDRFVPKDNDIIDLDSSISTDASSMIELANVNVAQLLDQELGGPERFFSRSKMITAMSMYGAMWTSSNTFFANDVFDINVSKKYRAMEDSGVLIGFGSPDMASVGVDAEIIEGTSGHSYDGFFTLKHIEDFLDKAMIEATPFTEAGSESPYEDIMNFLLDTLEEVNENTALFTAASWNVWIKATAGIRTPGRLSHTTLGPDAQA